MLKLKLSDRPPPNACLVAYYNGTRFDVESNLGFTDTSWEYAPNRTGYFRKARVHRIGTPHDPVGSGDVVVGNVSVRRRNLVDPIPLPWGYELGKENRFRRELLLFNPLADQYDPANQDEAEFAVAEIKKGIELVDTDGEVATDVYWDIGLVPDPTLPHDGRVAFGSAFGWKVFLYIDRETENNRPLMVRYNALDVSSNVTDPLVLYSYEELIAATPYLTGLVMEPNSAVPADKDYILEINPSANFRLVSNGLINTCMAIALWTEVPNRAWTVEPNGTDRDVIIWDVSDPNPANHIELGRVQNVMQRSVRETVHEINKLNLNIQATTLVDYASAELMLDSTKKVITNVGSEPLLMESHVFVYYPRDTKISTEKPVDLENEEDWFVNIYATPFRVTLTSGPQVNYILTYNVGEYAWQPYSSHFDSTLYDDDYLESIDEPAEFVAEDFIATRHRNFLPESLRVMNHGHDITSSVLDYDETSGAIRLERNILDADNITLRYAYKPDNKTVLQSLNFNPRQLHLPEGYRLYFGIYVIPSRVVNTAGVVTNFSPNLGYVIANTQEEIRTTVDNLTHVSSGLPVNAILLGIYQTNSQGEAIQVKTLDARSEGGGLKDDLDMESIAKRIPEAQFFSDIGYWDGEPYAGSGVIVVQVPTRLFGMDPTPVVNTPRGGFAITDGRQKPSDIRKRVDSHLTIGMTSLLDTLEHNIGFTVAAFNVNNQPLGIINSGYTLPSV